MVKVLLDLQIEVICWNNLAKPSFLMNFWKKKSTLIADLDHYISRWRNNKRIENTKKGLPQPKTEFSQE